MHKLTITGSGSDIIETSGDIEAKFYTPKRLDGWTGGFIAVSDGTLLKAICDNGVWRVFLIIKGGADFSKVEGSVESGSFDVVTLTLEEKFLWVGHVLDYYNQQPCVTCGY